MARRTHNRRHSHANMATTAERAARRAAERGGGGEDQDEREEDGRSGGEEEREEDDYQDAGDSELEVRERTRPRIRSLSSWIAS